MKVMDINKYNSRVLMGNWREDAFHMEEDNQEFELKEAKGELKIQKTREALVYMLKEVTLSLPEDCVCYGSIVQLLAPDLLTLPTGGSEKRGLTLSCSLSVEDVDAGRHLAEGCLLSAAPHLPACVRNAFVISSADGRERNGEPLCYGESFTLRPAVTKNGEEFYVQSMVGPLDSKVGPSGKPILKLVPKKDFYTRWHCLHIDPALRPETSGSPVNPNERLVICHSATNRRLAVEHAKWFKTLFGMECEVTLHTYLDVHKREMAENLWMIVTQTCGESKGAVRCMQ